MGRCVTPAQRATILGLIATTPTRDIAAQVGLSCYTVRKVARQGGQFRQHSWSQAEVDFLSAHWKSMSVKAIARHVSHTHEAINTKAGLLGLRKRHPWSQDDIDFLKTNWSSMSAKKMATHIPHSHVAIHTMACSLGLRKTRRRSGDAASSYTLAAARPAGQPTAPHT